MHPPLPQTVTSDPLTQPNFFELYLDEQKEAWQNHYTAAIFSVFDHWLTEAEARAAFDPYFAQVAGKNAPHVSMLEIERPYVAFFEALNLHGHLVQLRDGRQRTVSAEAIQGIALQAARETELIQLIDLETQTHVLPLHDLTLIAAVPVGQSLNRAKQWATASGLHELWRADPRGVAR